MLELPYSLREIQRIGHREVAKRCGATPSYQDTCIRVRSSKHHPASMPHRGLQYCWRMENEVRLYGSLGMYRLQANGEQPIGVVSKPYSTTLTGSDWTRCRIAVRAQTGVNATIQYQR